MNRPLKFRAWNTSKKCMYTAEEMGQDQEALLPDGRGFANISGISKNLTEIHSHLLPLQYTGLLDKNGKEIWEGDIISYPAWVRPKNSRLQTKAVVIWHIDGYAGRIKGEFAPHSLTGEWEKSKVIGNIWEHPELLEQRCNT